MAYIDNFGVQYSDDRKILIKFPIDYSGSYKIPEGVEFIEKGAFKEEYGLGSQPEYKGCDGLLSIVIPNSLDDIDIILKWCKNLQQISVDGLNPFYCVENGVLFDKDKTTLIKYFRTEAQDYYVVPDSVREIGEYAFAKSPYVVSVDLRHVNRINERAFESCNNLELIKMLDVQDIEQYAFCLCRSLRTIELPLGLERINSSLFYKCSALTSVGIPNSATKIGSNAFGECENLMSISIPESVGCISSTAFTNSGIYKTEANWENGVLYIGHFLIKARSLSGTYAIKDGTIQVCDSAFSHCDGLRTVILPEGVVYIGNYAFNHCEMLSKVTLPGTLKVIGYDAFADCSSLASVMSTESLSFDGIYIDSVDVRIPDSVITIGDGAFGDCGNFGSIAFPRGLSKIGDRVCVRCKGLKRVYLPATIESIGSSAFYGCSALKSINLPDSLSSVGYNVFEDCISISEIIVSRKSQDRFRVMKGLEDVASIIIGRDSEEDESCRRRSWDELKSLWQGVYHSIEGGETELDRKYFELLKNGLSPTCMPPVGVCLSSDEYKYYKASGYDLRSIHAWCWSGKDIHEEMRLHFDKIVGALTPRVGYYKVVGADIKEGEKPARLYCYYIAKDIRNKGNELDFVDEVVEINPSPLYNYYSHGQKNAEIKEGDIIKVLYNGIRDLHRTEGKAYVIYWEFCNLDDSRDMSSFSRREKGMSAQEIDDMRYAVVEEQFWDDFQRKLNEEK